MLRRTAAVGLQDGSSAVCAGASPSLSAPCRATHSKATPPAAAHHTHAHVAPVHAHSTRDHAHSRSWTRRFRLPLTLPSLPRMPAWPAALPSLASLPSLRTLRSLPGAAYAAATAPEAPDIPQLTYVDTPENRAVLALTPALHSPYIPTFWMNSAHAQTVLGTLLRFRPPIVYTRDILRLKSDGGTLALDWDSGRNCTRDVFVEPFTECSPAAPSMRPDPILFIIPGLTGGSRSKYLCQMVQSARAFGFRIVIMNFRGIMIPMTTAKPSTGINIADVIEALIHVHSCYPRAPIVALGFSMGGNMLVKTLGTMGDRAKKDANVVASAVVSCAFDYVTLIRNLHTRPLNRYMYSRFLTYQLKRNYIKQKAVADLSRSVKGLDLSHALKSQTICELDDRFTRHLYGIDSNDEYYRQQSSLYVVKDIATPLLCLNALDDPFEGTIPMEDIRANPHIILATTRRGGHVAWTQGTNPLAPKSSWMIETTLEYLAAALKVHAPQAAQAPDTGSSTTPDPVMAADSAQ